MRSKADETFVIVERFKKFLLRGYKNSCAGTSSSYLETGYFDTYCPHLICREPCLSEQQFGYVENLIPG